MPAQKSGLPVTKIYNTTISWFRKTPNLFIPFLIFSAVEIFTLFVLYLIPRIPLKVVFGPIVRALWGEAFLHYPANFFLLPKLISLARMGLAVLIGSLLTGMAVLMVADIYNGRKLNTKASFKLALKNYVSLFIIVFVLTIAFYLLRKIITIALVRYFSGHTRLLFLKANIWIGPIFSVLQFLITIFIQAVFIYAIPLLIIGKEKVIAAMVKSFVLFKRLFLPTVILVSLPMLLYIPIAILGYNNAVLMDKFFPEITLWVLILGALVTSLVIDAAITVSTTLLYLENKDKG